MGSYYTLYDKKCPYCGHKIPEVIYATCYEDYNAVGKYMGNYGVCGNCGGTFKVVMKFKLESLDD